MDKLQLKKMDKDIEILTVSNGFIVRPLCNAEHNRTPLSGDSIYVFRNSKELATFIEKEMKDD